MKPFANESDVIQINGMTAENRLDRVSLFGSMDITRDKIGLQQARQLHEIVSAILVRLEDEYRVGDLPAEIQMEKTVTVRNPARFLTGEGTPASPQDLAGRIRSVRRMLGLSQTAIAKATDSSLPSWQGYEAGKNVPGGNVLSGLAKLGININWLLLGEGSVYASQEKNVNDTPQQPDIALKVDSLLAEVRQAIFIGVDLLAKQLPKEPRSAGEVLDEIRRLKNLASDSALGGLFSVKQPTVASWRTRKTLPHEEIIKFCVEEGILLDDLFLKTAEK